MKAEDRAGQGRAACREMKGHSPGRRRQLLRLLLRGLQLHRLLLRGPQGDVHAGYVSRHRSIA